METDESYKEPHAKAEMGSQTGSQGDVRGHDSALVGMSRYEALRTCWVPILFSFLASFAATNDSFCFAIGGNLLANAGFIQQFGTVVNPETGAVSLDAHITSIWSGCASAMLIVGHTVAGILADFWGRRPNMYLQMLIMIASVVVQIVARSWGVWLLARILTGIAVGMIQVNTTMYVAEISPSQIRGSLIAAYSLFFGVGQLFAAIGMQIVQTNYPLRYLNAIHSQWVLIGLTLITMVVLPESPFYYAAKGKDAKAKKVLQRLYSRVPGYDVEKEYLDIKRDVEQQKLLAKEVSMWEIFRGTNLRRTMAAALAIGSQQVLGTSIYFIFSAYFFAAAGLQDPFLASLIIFILLNVFIIVSFWSTEKVGRRPLMIYGCGLMALFNICLGITGSVTPSVTAQKAALAMTCLWVITYAMTAAPVGFVMAAELGTPRLRAKTTAFAISVYGALNLIFTFCIPLFEDVNGTNWGVKAGYLFGGLSAIATVMIYLYLPETSGRTFSEMDELFEKGIPAKDFAKTKTSLQLSGAK